LPGSAGGSSFLDETKPFRSIDEEHRVNLQRAGGRPRLEGERAQEVLDLTLELLSEVGYDKLTLDTVAVRARASKATLYRHWSSKAQLVVDAMSAAHGEIPLPDTGSLRADLLALVDALGAPEPGEAQLMCSVSTAMATDAEFAQAMRERFVQPRLQALRSVLEAGRARGEVDDGVDLDLLASALPALMMFWGTVGATPPSPQLAGRIVDEVVLPAARSRGG
jgi:AcrR family transcriptional regulator